MCKFNNNNENNLKYQQGIDYYKRSLAVKNGINNYFEIDCCYSDYKYIKNSILESGLLNILPYTNISWDECNKSATSNLLKDVCNYYENDKKKLLVNIADKFGIDSCTVARYLKQGAELGFCTYDPKEANIMKSKSVKIFTQDGNFDVYESAKELQKISLNKYGVKLLKDGIQLVCRKKKNVYKGFYFEYV